MSWQAEIRAAQAAERQRQREAQKRRRELERRAKEHAKLTAAEQARLEVETHENHLEVLLSVHKEQGQTWDWLALAATLAPVCPQQFPRHEFKLRQDLEVLAAKDTDTSQVQARDAAVEQARLRDEQDYQNALRSYGEEKAERQKMSSLARRILEGEPKAYTEALSELSPFAEISDLGSSIHFTVHNAKLLESVLKINGRQAIPSEVKALTATGKVSVKSMPKARFHEIYQDYVCSCVLRVAREVFALLPVESLLITASADILDPRTGQTVEQPVLSAAIPRAVLARLDFDRIDPSDAMENFLHRGDFKASRGSCEFNPITPLTVNELPRPSSESMDFRDLITTVRRLRDDLRTELERLDPQPSFVASPANGSQ
jgi:hypothetical protein